MQSLRLVLVTPLILTRFNETEIAAWYLFASLNFFGTVMSQRLGLTFSRMFAFAMGGASNLAPIQGKREQENGGQPNWTALERAYGTVGSLNFGIGWLNVLIAIGMGWFGLRNLLDGYAASGVIWLAFGMLQASSLLSFNFQRYGIVLQGMNYIALNNRWGIIFSLLSLAAGSLTLWLGGGLLALVLVMQFFAVLGVFRNRFLLRRIEDGRVLRFRQYDFDREVFSWAWEPTWKGLINNLAALGVSNFSAILFSGYGNVSIVATYIFSLRMIETLTQVSQAPFASLHPCYARLRAQGEIERLRGLVITRMRVSLLLLLVGGSVFGVLVPFALKLIGSQISLIEIGAWQLILGLMMAERFNVFNCGVSAAGNKIVFVWHYAVAAFCSVVCLFLSLRYLPEGYLISGLLLSIKLPALLILFYQPARLAENILQLKRFELFKRVYLPILVAYLLISFSLINISIL